MTQLNDRKVEDTMKVHKMGIQLNYGNQEELHGGDILMVKWQLALRSYGEAFQEREKS